MIWIKSWRVPFITLAVGIGGIFGYHFLYFSAFRHAPAIEVNLINYLWPLLIVLLTPLILPGTRLKRHHLLGAFIGLAGAGLILTGGHFSLDFSNLTGYAIMACAALTWACYSLFTKRLPPFPSSAVGAFCLASGVLSLIAYSFSSGSFQGLSRLTSREWMAVFLLGIGPMGAAFYAWDAALKRGDPRIIGSLAYLIPLSSTMILVFAGGRSLTWVSALAMVLIIGGAIIGSLDLIIPRRKLI
jgi:drug/metabolite transporter (DMT)-like permease